MLEARHHKSLATWLGELSKQHKSKYAVPPTSLRGEEVFSTTDIVILLMDFLTVNNPRFDRSKFFEAVQKARTP